MKRNHSGYKFGIYICWFLILLICAAYVFALAPPASNEIKRGFVVLEVTVDNRVIQHDVQCACKRDFIIYLKRLLRESL